MAYKTPDGKYFDSKNVEISKEQYEIYVQMAAQREANKMARKKERDQEKMELKKEKENLRTYLKEAYKALKEQEIQQIKDERDRVLYNIRHMSLAELRQFKQNNNL